MTGSSMATGGDVSHVTPNEVPLEGWVARMRNRKLRNIRPSGAFSPEVTSVNVTRRGFPWNWKSRDRKCLFYFHESVFNNYISYNSLLLLDMFEVLCSTPRVYASAFSLWYFY